MVVGLLSGFHSHVCDGKARGYFPLPIPLGRQKKKKSEFNFTLVLDTIAMQHRVFLPSFGDRILFYFRNTCDESSGKSKQKKNFSFILHLFLGGEIGSLKGRNMSRTTNLQYTICSTVGYQDVLDFCDRS